MADVSINVGTDGGRLDRSPVTIGNVAGGDQSVTGDGGTQEEERLRQRVHELEQFVFGDQKLGIVGIREQLRGQRFWNLFNVALTSVLIIYEIIRFFA